MGGVLVVTSVAKRLEVVVMGQVDHRSLEAVLDPFCEANALPNVFGQVFADLSIQVVHGKKRVLEGSALPGGDGVMD
jgi:hypothetical protein